MTPKKDQLFLTRKEAANRLGINPKKLLELKIPRYKLYGCHLFLAKDVDAYQGGGRFEKLFAASDETLTRAQFAEWIRTHPGTVKRWAWNGRGPDHHKGRPKVAARYPLTLIVDWLNQCREVAV